MVVNISVLAEVSTAAATSVEQEEPLHSNAVVQPAEELCAAVQFAERKGAALCSRAKIRPYLHLLSMMSFTRCGPETRRRRHAIPW